MINLLYFLIPLVVLSFIIVAYLGLKNLNDKLKKDLLSSSKNDAQKHNIVRHEIHELAIKEMSNQIQLLSIELKNLRQDYEASRTSTLMSQEIKLKLLRVKMLRNLDSEKYVMKETDYNITSIKKPYQTAQTLTYSIN